MDDDIDPETAADRARMAPRERWRYFHSAAAWGAALGVVDRTATARSTTGRTPPGARLTTALRCHCRNGRGARTPECARPRGR